MKAKDRLKIFENIIARVGLDGDVIGEYTRTLATMNGLDSVTALQAQQPIMPPQTQNNAVQPTLAPNEAQVPLGGESAPQSTQMA